MVTAKYLYTRFYSSARARPRFESSGKQSQRGPGAPLYSCLIGAADHDLSQRNACCAIMRTNSVKILHSVINKISSVNVNVIPALKGHIWTQYSHLNRVLSDGASTLPVHTCQIDTPCSNDCDIVAVGGGRCFMHQITFKYAECSDNCVFCDQLTTHCSRIGKNSLLHDRALTGMSSI